MTCLPGQKGSKDQQQSLVDIHSDKPVALQRMMTVGVHLRDHIVMIQFILEDRNIQKCCLKLCEHDDTFVLCFGVKFRAACAIYLHLYLYTNFVEMHVPTSFGSLVSVYMYL